MTPSIRRRAKRREGLKEHRQLLVDLPLDVLVEIFLLLEPLDLLHLSRTSKVLRGFLLDRRKASALWKNVTRNVEGFPPCPDHMSAPAYIHLAFVPVCHGCFSPCETVDWQLRMRYCPDCFPKMTISLDSIRYKSTYLDSLYLPAARRRYKLLDSGWDITVTSETTPPYVSLCSRLDWKVVQSRKRPRNVSMEEFVDKQNEYWESILRHARLCQTWQHRRLEEEAAMLSIVREERIHDIQDKLKDTGLTDVWSFHRNYYNFLQLPEVRKLKPLTLTEWVEIRPGLVSWARKAREYLIADHCRSILSFISFGIQQELSNNPSVKVEPQEVDIAALPVVQSVLESNQVARIIDSNAIYDCLMLKLLRSLTPAATKWSLRAVEELERHARGPLGLLPRSKPSSLLSAIFKCKKCPRSRSRFTFDEALSHGHLYREKGQDKRKQTDTMSVHDKVLATYETYPRDIQVLKVDINVSLRVENLIRRMGQNPSRVTRGELSRSTVRVVCGLCDPRVAIKMDFECAFGHCLGTHMESKTTEVWTRAPARD